MADSQKLYYNSDYFNKKRTDNTNAWQTQTQANQNAYTNSYNNATTAYNNASNVANNTYNNASNLANTAYNSTVNNAQTSFDMYKAQLDRNKLNSTAQLASAKENAKMQMNNYLKALGLQGSGLGQSAMVQNNANYMNNLSDINEAYNDNYNSRYNEYQNAINNAELKRDETVANALTQRDNAISNATATRDIAYNDASTALDKANSETNAYYQGISDDIDREEAYFNEKDEKQLQSWKENLASKGISTNDIKTFNDYIDALSTWANSKIEKDENNTIDELRNQALDLGLTTSEIEKITDVSSFQTVIGDYNLRTRKAQNVLSKADGMTNELLEDYVSGNISYEDALDTAKVNEATDIIDGELDIIKSSSGYSDYAISTITSLEDQYKEILNSDLTLSEKASKLSDISEKLDYYSDTEKGYGSTYDIQKKLGDYKDDANTNWYEKNEVDDKGMAQLIASLGDDQLQNAIDFLNGIEENRNKTYKIHERTYFYRNGKWNFVGNTNVNSNADTEHSFSGIDWSSYLKLK